MTRPRLLMEFALRYTRFYPGVNSRAELVTLAPGLRPDGVSRSWLGIIFSIKVMYIYFSIMWRSRLSSNGSRTGNVFTEGSTVYFKCDNSSDVLSGSSSTTCQSNRTWSNPTPPRCKYTDRMKHFMNYNKK